jgi:ribosomal protein L5
MNRMKERYKPKMVPALKEPLNLENTMQVPQVKKVVINIGLGEALDNPKALDAAVNDLIAHRRSETGADQSPHKALRTSSCAKAGRSAQK